MKKAIPVLCISLFLFLSLSAAELTRVATVNVYDAEINSQEGHDADVSFVLSNRDGAQANIKFGVQLYDSEGRMVHQKVFPENVYLGAGERMSFGMLYSAPDYLNGKYQLWVISENTAGMRLGQNKAGEIELSGSEQYMELLTDQSYLTVSGDSNRYTLSQGVDVAPNEELKINFKIRNHFDQIKKFGVVAETHKRTQFGDTVSKEEIFAGAMPASATDDFSATLPTADEPQAYNVLLTIVDEDGNVISNQQYAHYVLRGGSGTIQNIVLDKDGYLAGESAVANVYWTPSADSFPGARGDATELSRPSLEIQIFSGDIACSDKVTEYLSESVTDIELPIKAECEDPVIEAALKDQSQTLDEKVYEIETREQTNVTEPSDSDTGTDTDTKGDKKTDDSKAASGDSSGTIIVLAVVLILLAAGFMYMKKMQKKTKK